MNDNLNPEDQIGMTVRALFSAIHALAAFTITHNDLMQLEKQDLTNALGHLQIVVSAVQAGPMLQAAE